MLRLSGAASPGEMRLLEAAPDIGACIASIFSCGRERNMAYPKQRWFVGLLFLVATCLGCGESGPEIASVEGKVTLDGQPLPNAAVVFIPENGRPAGARTDAQGNYVLNFTEGRKGAMLGKNRVRISTAADPSETPDGQPIPAVPEKIPLKYNANTELEFTVESGKKNIANFDLASGGKLPEPDLLTPVSKK
jgi:hypothetical protein